MIYVFDTCALIEIREYYLRSTGLFKHFWGWLLGLMHTRRIIIPDAVYQELQSKKLSSSQTQAAPAEGKKDAFFKILVAEGIPPLEEDAAIKTQAKVLNAALSRFTSGLSEEDGVIIATAKALGATLVTAENPQENLPPEGSSTPYRMPGACKLPEVNVKCVGIKGFMKEIAKERRERRCRPNELL
ncbi:MAG: DUF4411 family protein [Betaproteobacteria bacterium AqS2]|uniref:DUF4411 family protein n=1 Tax=Candidatus Amphirhobacter heronislandensis TaxID=1732024 RepID=A0A930UHG1_9GAMM|nr:DUF4411 family protein [Betaproteobacteria bacterium AqS2]